MENFYWVKINALGITINPCVVTTTAQGRKETT